MAPIPVKKENVMSTSSDSQITRLTNCQILIDGTLRRDDLWVCQGKILHPEKCFFEEKRSPAFTLDCRGAIVTPGFIDVQVNGGFGLDFSSPSEHFVKDLRTVAEKLPRYGVTSFLATVISSTPSLYHIITRQLQDALDGCKARLLKTTGGAQVLGLHLEGPFISPSSRGMHDPNNVLGDKGLVPDAEQALHQAYGTLDPVRLLTIAPEVPGATDAIRYLVQRGIQVSLGHSVASFDEGLAGLRCGARMITHLFCAMRPFHHRDPHLVGLLACRTDINFACYYSVIADLLHTHPAALRIAQKSCGDGVILITDANVALGLPDGQYQFGSRAIDVRDGHSYLRDSDTLAGGTTPLDECLRRYISSTHCPVAEALSAVTERPAALLQLQGKGFLREGYDADFTLLHPDTLDVMATFVEGTLVYEAQDCSLRLS